MSLRVWSEELPFEVVGDPALLAELGRRGIELALAVEAGQDEGALDVVQAALGAGAKVALWPLLADSKGRWLSAENVDPFVERVRSLAALARRRDLPPLPMVFDMEPPIETLRGITAARPRDLGWLLRRRDHRNASKQLAGFVGELRGCGHFVEAVAAPMLAWDGAAEGWQSMLGTPVDDVGFDRVGVMAYTSLFEGYGRGVIRRHDAMSLLELTANALRRRFGTRGALALGVVGGGVLGTERAYRDPAELAADVATARAAGVEHLALYALDGIVARQPLGPWLDALAGHGCPAPAWRRTRRSRLIAGTLRQLPKAHALLSQLDARALGRNARGDD